MIGVGTPPPAEVRSGSTSRGRASERECWIALSVLPGIGPAGFARLVGQYASPICVHGSLNRSTCTFRPTRLLCRAPT